MDDLKDQLLKAQLISRDQFDEARKKENSGWKTNPDFTQKELKKLSPQTSINQFKKVARRVLVQERRSIYGLIDLAHKLTNSRGRKQLIRKLYQIREGLSSTPDDELEPFVKEKLN